MDELLKRIAAFRARFTPLYESARIPEKEQRFLELSASMSAPDFWSDRAAAQAVSQEASHIEKSVAFWTKARERLTGIEEITKADERDHAVSLLDELSKELSALEEDVSKKEIELWLAGPYDTRPAIVTIYSGAGGVDAQDWARMLERMYLRFAERHAYDARVIQRTPGQEAGIKNVTLRIEGTYSYGYLRAESGVHRLVRISPFDADQSRHTSFAMVEVLPELDTLADIEIPKDDVRMDVFRSSGAGGQSVNRTDSAVRLTHLPTGIMVVCQNERSQLQNREQAWKILLGKLERYYATQREEERLSLRGELTDAAWGNQLRSYVIHPYKLVKDHRTKLESTDPDDVLDGNLMPFIEAELRRLSIEAED